jgi:hypothetical protein
LTFVLATFLSTAMVVIAHILPRHPKSHGNYLEIKKGGRA